MRRLRRLALAIPILAGLAASLLLGPVAVSRDFVVPNPPGLVVPGPFALLGTSSCASAACHNQEVAGVKGREYDVARQDLAHQRAYEVLFGERSQKMVRAYYPQLKHAPVVSPQHDALCVKCHVHPCVTQSPIATIEGSRQFRLEDGVSCESCHGAAGGWIDRHHRPEWKTISAHDKRTQFGMEDTRSIAGRARTCVRCHVGGPDAEVDHELIAAGHPRLAFEFSGYHSLMSKHWDEAIDRDPACGGRPDFERQAWAEGQLVALEAALTLLKHRLRTNRFRELAEFDCYACHHDLKKVGDKQDREYIGRKPGQVPWNVWNTCQLDSVADLLGKASSVGIALVPIRDEMQKLKPARTADVDRALAEVSAALCEVQGLPPLAFSARDAMKRLSPKAFGSWDEAAQYHNAIRALEQVRLDTNQPEIPGVRGGLIELRNSLLVDPRYRLTKAWGAGQKIKSAVE